MRNVQRVLTRAVRSASSCRSSSASVPTDSVSRRQMYSRGWPSPTTSADNDATIDEGDDGTDGDEADDPQLLQHEEEPDEEWERSRSASETSPRDQS